MKLYIADQSNTAIEIADFSKNTGAIESAFETFHAEWSRDVDQYFDRKGFKYVKTYFVGEAEGDPQFNASHEAKREAFAEHGFNVEGLEYVVVISRKFADQIDGEISTLFHEKMSKKELY